MAWNAALTHRTPVRAKGFMSLSIEFVAEIGIFLAGTGLFGLAIVVLQSGTATSDAIRASNRPIMLIPMVLIILGGRLAAVGINALMSNDATRQRQVRYRPYVFISVPAIMPLADAMTSD